MRLRAVRASKDFVQPGSPHRGLRRSQGQAVDPRLGFTVSGRRAILLAMMKRILRIAGGFEEAAEIDRRDVAAMSFEERISGVERLRRVWVGEDRAESRLERVLVCVDRPASSLRDGRRSRVTASPGSPRISTCS